LEESGRNEIEDYNSLNK